MTTPVLLSEKREWNGAVPASEEPSPARIEAFSDGVFSIIATLLVLDLRVPREAMLRGQPLLTALADQWPLYLAYVVSFLQVGVVWANHHTMFHHIKKSDHVLLVLNLLLLMCIAVLPFTTAILSEYAKSNFTDLRVAAFTYSALLGLAGVFFVLIWKHADRRGLIQPHVDEHRIAALGLHWLFVPLLYGLAFLLVFINPYLGMSVYLLLLFYYAFPGPIFIRWMTRRRTRQGGPAS
ncbi:TMEM175 family protein [Alsobacter sp. SYSU BS001988]|jgi:uncharacterized membrane protein